MGKKIQSGILLAAGVLAAVAGIAAGAAGMQGETRGYLLLAGVILVLFGLLRLPVRHHNRIVNVVFLIPVILAFTLTVVVPFLLGIFYSFTDWNGMTFTEFLGLGNYIKIFREGGFLYSVLITFLFTVINLTCVNVIAFALALLCTSKIRCRNFMRAAFFMPNLIGGIVLGYVWQFIFNKVFVAVVPGSVSMLSDPNLAFVAIVIVSTWQYAGYIMMIYVTGLQGVPTEIVEAASVDGANSRQTLFGIKIPMIANTFTVCIFLSLTSAFKQFDVNLALTNGAPSRILGDKIIQSTEFIALKIYNTSIGENDYAAGQTMSVLFFIVLVVISLAQVYISKKREVEV